MGLINDDSLYPVDTALSGNEQLIGSDSDTNETTKQYKLSDILAYVQSNIEVDGLTIDQNNIIRIIPMETQTGSNYNIATLVNSGNIEWEYSEEAGNTGQINVEDTWNVVFRVPVITSYSNIVNLQYDYYWLINQGKGVIGSGSGVTLEASNFLKMPSSGTVTLPNDNNLNPPTVYTLSASDITSPQVVLNDDPGSYVVNSATADTYFIMQEVGQVLIPVPDATKIYRFVGANGTYGAAGVDASVPADFVLVDSSGLESTSSPTKKPNVRTINVAGVIDDAGGETIKTVVDATLRGDIVHVPDEILFITANRLIENSDNTYRIMEELYVWGGALGDITTGSSLSDFQYLTSFPVVDTVTPTVSASPNVVALANADINAPEDAVNASAASYVIDGSADFVFIIFDADADSGDYKIYKFVGANATYGSGGTSAVPSDFNEITQLSPGGRPIRKTSQLKNDGEDGTNPFISAYEGYVESGTQSGNDLSIQIGDTGEGIYLDYDRATNRIRWGLLSSNRSGIILNSLNSIYSTWQDTGGTVNAPTGYQSITFAMAGIGQTLTNAADYTINIGRGNVISSTADYSGAIGSDISLSNTNQFAAGSVITIDGQASAGIGAGLNPESYAEVVVGTWNTTYSATGINSYNSADRAFIVGIGASSGARADGFIVMKTGDASFPGLTVALIDAAGVKSAVTKEWALKQRTSGYTVATLPATPTTGDRAYVTDANAPTFRATVAGGGSDFTPVIYDGTNWICA